MSGEEIPTLDTMNMQIIEFSENEEVTNKSIGTGNTTIYGSAGTHTHGSAHVKLKNVVKYVWEVKQYPGRIIAAHRDGVLVAFVLNVSDKGEMVRVLETRTGARALIKGMKGEVLDLQFSYLQKKVLLASIDKNTLYVHEITLDDGTVNYKLLLKVNDPDTEHVSGYDKVIWCPYVNRVNSDSEDEETKEEEDEEEEQHCWYVAWAKGHTFQCINVRSIVDNNKKNTVTISELQAQNQCLSHTDPKITITTMAFSPDGSTLGVGCEEGFIRFYQVYMYDQNIRCLHQWNPHNSKPVSSLFFLDDINRCRSDVYWQYALTACNNNTEFKLWDCGNWSCSQNVYLATKSEHKQQQHKYLAELDPTATYVVVSCFELRTIYVFQIMVQMHAPNNFPPRIISVSEFPMQSGILSFSLGGDIRNNCKSCAYMDEMEERDGFYEDPDCVALQLFIVQPKGMQSCRILYRHQKEMIMPEDFNATESINNTSSPFSTAGNNDNESSGTTTTPPTVRSISTTSKNELNDSLSPHVLSSSNRNSAKLETASEKKTDLNVSSDVFNTILLLASVAGQTPHAAKPDGINSINLLNNKMLEDQEHKKLQLRKSLEKEKPFVAIDNHPERHIAEHVPSGSSSPSREVQEILSWQQSFSSDNEEVQKTTTVTNDATDALAKETAKPANLSKPPSAGLQTAANLIAQVVHNSSNNNSTLESTHHQNESSSSDRCNDLQDINNKMNQMLGKSAACIGKNL